MPMRMTLAVLCVLAVTSCEPRPSSPPETPQSVAEEPISIVRADADIERDEPALEPLQVAISFAEGGSALGGAGLAQLTEILASPQMQMGGNITLGGHTDSAGNDEANLRASQERAEAVKDYLMANDVDGGRIEIIAFGEQNPGFANALPDGAPNLEGQAANRRVEVTIAVPQKQELPKEDEEPLSLIEQVSTED